MTDQFVGSLRHSDRTFRVLSHCQTGYAEVGRLLLQAPGVCDCEGGARYDIHEVDVGYWVKQVDTVDFLEPVEKRKALQVLHRSRVRHENQANIGGYFFQRVDDAFQGVSIIDVRRAVQRHDAVFL